MLPVFVTGRSPYARMRMYDLAVKVQQQAGNVHGAKSCMQVDHDWTTNSAGFFRRGIWHALVAGQWIFTKGQKAYSADLGYYMDPHSRELITQIWNSVLRILV